MPPIIPQRELQDGISEEEVCAAPQTKASGLTHVLSH